MFELFRHERNSYLLTIVGVYASPLLQFHKSQALERFLRVQRVGQAPEPPSENMTDLEEGTMAASMVSADASASDERHEKPLAANRHDKTVDDAPQASREKGEQPDVLSSEASPREVMANSDADAVRPLPGAYRMYPTDSRGESLDVDALLQAPAPAILEQQASTILEQQASASSRAFAETAVSAHHLPCVEATAVSDTLLVVAKPFRRNVWVMTMVIMAVGVIVAIAVAVGISVTKTNRSNFNLSSASTSNSTNNGMRSRNR